MAETLTLTLTTSAESSEIALLDVETFRSQLKVIQESRAEPYDPSEISVSDPRMLIEEITSDFQEKIKQLESEESNVATLGPSDLDAFLEQLRKEIGSTEEESLGISNQIDVLTRTLAGDSDLLDADLESLAFSLNLIDSQGLNFRSCSRDAHESPMDVTEDHKFEILKVQQQIENCQNNLNILQDLDFVYKRLEAIDQIEDKLSEIKVLEFEGNSIRLSLKTQIPSSDGLLLRHKLDCLVEPSVVEHELSIEVVDKTLEPLKVEIFPNDVPLEDIIHSVKSPSHLAIARSGSKLECLVRQVQYRIILCTIKRLVLKDAKKSRHSFEYSDRDETITAHMVGGIDAFIKIPQSWPVSDSNLKLVSIKQSDIGAKNISLSFLYKIKELANCLNIQTRGHLVQFMDAIEEILVQEMHS